MVQSRWSMSIEALKTKFFRPMSCDAYDELAI